MWQSMAAVTARSAVPVCEQVQDETRMISGTMSKRANAASVCGTTKVRVQPRGQAPGQGCQQDFECGVLRTQSRKVLRVTGQSRVPKHRM